jgi:DNA-binding cell septation regulator SpoVG
MAGTYSGRRGGASGAFPLPSFQGRTNAPATVQIPAPQAPAITITVVQLRPSTSSGNLRCFASVQFGKWIVIHGFRLVHEEGKRPFVGMPSNQRDEADPDNPGSRKRTYFPLCSIPDNWKRAAEQAVLDAWQEYQQTGILPGGDVVGGQGQ